MKGLYGSKGFVTEIRQRGDVVLKPHQVRLKVLACGVCGTDLHFLRDAADATPMGHEISAEVIAVGSDVTRVKVGDRVICEDVTLCGVCDHCKSGRPWLCRSGYTLEDQPGMSDEMAVHENMLHVYEDIDPVTATMTEPMAVAISGIDCLPIDTGTSIIIYGMGTIGLFSAAYARLLGAERIAMVARKSDSIRNRKASEIAKQFGADEIYFTDDPDYKSKALEKGSFDYAVIAAPPKLTADALQMVGYGGTVLVLGVTLNEKDAAVNIDVSDMVFNKKQLRTFIAEPARNFDVSLRLIKSGRIDAAAVITHVIGMSEHEKLKDLYDKDSDAVKTVIRCNE